MRLLKKRKRSFRVFIGPNEVAGYYGRLAGGFKEMGVECDFFTYGRHKFGYGGESPLPKILRYAENLDDLALRQERFRFIAAIFRCGRDVLRTGWALYAILVYDAFIFGFGSSLIRKNLDLIILKVIGKPVISVLAHGSEARPSYLNGAFQRLDMSELRAKCEQSKAVVNRHERYATYVIGSPLSTSQLAQKPFIHILAVGSPAPVGLQTPVTKISKLARKGGHSTVRILHAPSSLDGKGTSVIRDVIRKLRSDGLPIEYHEVHGQPNSVVLSEIERCDFLVDQIYSDAAMGGLSTEAALFGRASIVGGYGLTTLKSTVPGYMWPPTFVIPPDAIEDAIRRLVENSRLREDYATKANDFVRSQWAPKAVAERYMRLLQSDIPDDWWFDPGSLAYTDGYGLSQRQRRQLVKSYIEQNGVHALGLSHRERLRRKLLEEAGFKN